MMEYLFCVGIRKLKRCLLVVAFVICVPAYWNFCSIGSNVIQLKKLKTVLTNLSSQLVNGTSLAENTNTGGRGPVNIVEHALYKTYLHRNIFNTRQFEYRLMLSRDEQWALVNSSASRLFLPRRNVRLKTEREIAHYQHLDLLGLKSLEFIKKMKNPCWYDENKLLRCLPYFYLIGAPKCGTTDIHKKLEIHQDFIPSRTKEPHWLTRGRIERNLTMFRLIDYLAYFSKLSEQLNNAIISKDLREHLITGDCSASTMWDNFEWINLPRNENPLEPQYTNADYVYHLNPKAKIIFILRNPITRLYSDYLFFDKESRKSPANFHRKVVDAILIFTACLRATSLRSCVYSKEIEALLEVRLYIGIYFIYLIDWYRKFPSEQILPLNLEEYSTSLNHSLMKIFHSLDLRPPTELRLLKMLNMGRANTRNDRNINVGPMWPETRQLLYKFYKPFNIMLADLLQDRTFDYGSK